MGITGCQTMWCLCKECFNYKCGQDLEHCGTFIYGLPESEPFCAKCRDEKQGIHLH